MNAVYNMASRRDEHPSPLSGAKGLEERPS